MEGRRGIVAVGCVKRVVGWGQISRSRIGKEQQHFVEDEDRTSNSITTKQITLMKAPAAHFPTLQFFIYVENKEMAHECLLLEISEFLAHADFHTLC